MPAFHTDNPGKRVPAVFLLLALSLLISLDSLAQSPSRFQALYKKAETSGPVRVIVTASGGPLPPDRRSMAPHQFDSLLADSVRAAQSRVLEVLRPETVLNNPVRFTFTPQFVVEITAAGVADLAGNPDVAGVQEDVPDRPFLDQSVPHIFATHDISPYSGKGWTVAVLDTGVDKNHPFLAGKVVAEACYSTANSIAESLCPDEASSSTAPDSGLPCSPWISGCDHGTHVAGIAAGDGDTFDGVARDAEIIAVQVFSMFDSLLYCGSLPAPCALSYISDQILGLQRIYGLRTAFSIASANLSIGSGYYTSFCDGDSRKATIDLLKDAGIATVAASGNNSYTDGVNAPGCISTAITVGATNDTEDTRASFSNSGPQLDFYAPGLSIYSSIPGGGYSAKGGTSMAAPHVAGAWAVLREKYAAETVDEIETRLDSSGVTVTVVDVSRRRIDISETLDGVSGGGPGFIPVTPCRIADTRISGGIIPAGATRDFKVYGSDADIREQGGEGDCGISWTSKAVVLNITSPLPDGRGHLRVYPYDSPLPVSSLLNISSGLTTANATISGICQPACLHDISVYSSADSHVVIDVMGYME